MQAGTGLLAAAMTLSVMLAGCAGGASDVAETPTPTTDPTDDTGGIEGRVLNTEQLPVPDAEVAVLEAEQSAVTDEDGTFAFNDLDPGSYRLVVQKLGYDSAARAITVAAGQVIEIEFALEAITVTPDPFTDVLIFDGFIQCGVNPYLPMNLCGQALGDDKDRFWFEPNLNVPLGEVMVELVWTPTSVATAQHLELDLCDQEPEDSNQVLCESDDHYWQYQSGTSPVVIREDELPVDEATMYEVNAGAGLPATDDPLSLTPVFQQEFQIYVSLCYVDACGDDYTAVPA